MAPRFSILVTTYNRAHLLPRALSSILKQSFTDFEVIVVDDCSPDNTPEVMKEFTDPRIRYIRNPENVAQKDGDRAIFSRFVHDYSAADWFLWLCDDDFWIPADLLERHVQAIDAHPDLSMSVGAMAQYYPEPFEMFRPNAPYITHERVGDDNTTLFARGLFPDGFMPGDKYLNLYAEDPKNRNIVTGATAFRKSAYVDAGLFTDPDNGVRWQSGYEMLAGTASMGDVNFIDDPCVGTTVEIGAASYRGTQYGHMRDCINSITAGFRHALTVASPQRRACLLYYRQKMMHSIMFTYVLNKLTYHLGHFDASPLAGIEDIFEPAISSREFIDTAEDFDIPLTAENRQLIALADLPAPQAKMFHERYTAYGAGKPWFEVFAAYPSDRPPPQGCIL